MYRVGLLPKVAGVRLYATKAREHGLFDKILIANRGEIACRVMKTAKRLGVRTVAVFSDADRNSMHVQMADEAYHIGASPSRESYLRMDRILDVAKRTGAQGIHPGYGFLSENAAFAEACGKEGVTFIGPPASAIRSMGSKSASKIIMSNAGVPIIGGYHGEDQSYERLKAEADKIGYPVLIKAVMGGGGKGMRIVERPEDFESMLESSRREAMKSFNDDHVLVEKYVVRPRHVEVQVFADTHGNAVHLFERDCSVQRRHQKVIEEAPAPDLRPEVREAIGLAAVRAAQAVNYVGAGTVEFIMDPQQRFYFMEMNTRLQVEHPVTEMITGVDLVEWQLKVASGQALPLRQSEIKEHGHSFEARIYAEDPDKNFLPGSGPIHFLSTPPSAADLRVETGVRQGDQVTVFYDPMIAKLVVWDQDRRLALRKLRQALAQFKVGGLRTNLNFLGDIAAHPAFERAEVETHFIENHQGTLFSTRAPLQPHHVAQAALAHLHYDTTALAAALPKSEDTTSPWGSGSHARLNSHGSHSLGLLDIDGSPLNISITALSKGAYSIKYTQGGQTHTVSVEGRVEGGPSGEAQVSAHVDGRYHQTTVFKDNDSIYLYNNDKTVTVGLPVPAFVHKHGAGDAPTNHVLAPMTGKIEKMLVAAGQRVEKGTPLVILEAMKMEHVIRAPMSGVVGRVAFESGAFVDQHALLLAFQDDAKDSK
eukprot:Colp12_sorted_trinity150504_noHs@19407